MNDDKKIEACAKAAQEMKRAVLGALDAHHIHWEELSPFAQEVYVRQTKAILEGEPIEGLPAAELTLMTGAVRIAAAALGMTVTFPESSAYDALGPLPAVPALPKRTIDWSTSAHAIR